MSGPHCIDFRAQAFSGRPDVNGGIRVYAVIEGTPLVDLIKDLVRSLNRTEIALVRLHLDYMPAILHPEKG